MQEFFKSSPKVVAAVCVMVGVFCFSLNDVSIKYLSTGYPLHEITLIRSAVALCFIMAVIVPLNGGISKLRTKLLKIHIIRGICVVCANMFFFMALAALPIADAVAIFFISPLLITILSIIFLNEKVGVWRWSSILIGLVGVLIISRPGTAAFQIASVLPMLAALCYAFLHILTRKIRATESASTMAFYIQLTFLVISIAIGLTLGDGRFNENRDPSLSFIFREWIVPVRSDYLILTMLGITSALGGLLISQAYRLGEAAFVAPFEYIAMPMAIFWGIIIFSETPGLYTWLGILLIISSGLFMVWRETKTQKVPKKIPRYRRPF